jgi:hypothetical protein
MKRPAFQFYPKEWIWDFELRQCSPAARGLWVDLLCLMHEGQPYGHLTIPTDLILRVTGLSEKSLKKLLAELEIERSNGKKVAYRTPSGVLYSKRMVRDEELRNASVINGKAGGNPRLLKGRVNPGVAERGLTSPEDEEKRREDSLFQRQWNEFRSLYPARRFDEELALRAYLSREDEHQAIMAGLLVAVKCQEWADDGGKYVPRASRFISDGIYKDLGRFKALDEPRDPYYRWSGK